MIFIFSIYKLTKYTIMATKNQLIELINYSPELKKQLKENYYKIKIQEAKNKKKELTDNKNSLWELLPPDVEQKILAMKEESDKDYISYCCGSYNLTMKSLKDYLFNQYENEGKKLKQFLAINYDFQKFIWIMINNKEWSEHYYKREQATKTYDTAIKHWKKTTKNKAPSLLEFIEYRKKEKEELSKKIKEKNKERAKEEIKVEGQDFKIGDLIYDIRKLCENRDYHQAYIIKGETRTQWRVDLIEWDEKYNVVQCQGHTRYKYYLEDKNLWNRRKKHKNLSKKSFLNKFQEKDKVEGTNRYCIIHNDYYD